jgi:hypothetical protein
MRRRRQQIAGVRSAWRIVRTAPHSSTPNYRCGNALSSRRFRGEMASKGDSSTIIGWGIPNDALL